MFRVPSPHEHGTVLHSSPGVSAVVLDGFAVHEDESVLRRIAEVFGLGHVEAAPSSVPAAPVVAPPAPVVVDEGDAHPEE